MCSGEKNVSQPFRQGHVRLVATLERPLNGATCTVSLSSHFNYIAFLFSLEAIRGVRGMQRRYERQAKVCESFSIYRTRASTSRTPFGVTRDGNGRLSLALSIWHSKPLAWTTLTGRRKLGPNSDTACSNTRKTQYADYPWPEFNDICGT